MCVSCGCLPSGGQPWDDHGDCANLTIQQLQAAANAAGLSLADVAANISQALVIQAQKSVSHDYAAIRVVKASEERRYTLGVAYPANKADISVAADGHRDFVSPEALEKCAWEWMAKHREINLFHKDRSSGHGVVVESYLYRGPDWEQPSPVDGKPYVIKAGDWLLGAVWDEYGWSLVKSGLVNGWSPEGGAKRGIPTPEKLAQLRN